MFHLRQAVVELIEQVKAARDSDVRVTQPITDTSTQASKITPIDWLDAQPLFPKFYWQSRNGEEEVVALGQVCTFSEPAPAYKVIKGEQRIWGGRSFDGGTAKNPDCVVSFFFLPQVELYRQGEKWFLAVNLGTDREDTIRTLESLVLHVSPLTPVDASVGAIDHCPGFSQWQSLVDDSLQRIEQDEFKKVVLARKSTITPNLPISAAQLLKQSTLSNNRSFHFLFSVTENNSFIGSTPERLYLRDGLQLETEALAGTIGRGDSKEQDLELADWLVHDEKNLAENQYVVDDIIECLTPHSRTIEVQENARLVCLRNVQHLRRRLHVSLQEGVNGVHLLGALQPTAAVAGLPREEAMNYILDNEPFQRGWYAGSMGYISHQRAEFCVAIRSAQFTGEKIQLYAGAGILPGSDAAFEWQELDRKMATLLGLFKDDSCKQASSKDTQQ